MSMRNGPLRTEIRVITKRLREVEVEVDHLRALVEDTILSPKDKRELEASIGRIEKGDTSEFVRWPPSRGRHV